MLKQLYIKNFTLIDELDIQLHPGFSVITGEKIGRASCRERV